MAVPGGFQVRDLRADRQIFRRAHLGEETGKVASSVYPRLFEVLVEISFGQYQGIEELFRALHDLHVVAPLSQTITAFDQFSKQSYPAQISQLMEIVLELTANGELIIVIDDGGVYDDQGDYQPFFKDIIESLNKVPAGLTCTYLRRRGRQDCFRRKLSPTRTCCGVSD